ncbi:hypothetical protein [Sphingomonas sp. F9_3S_D5_B_2]
MRPSSVLLELSTRRATYEQHFSDGRIVFEIYLDRTRAMPTETEMDELLAKRAEIQRLCEADERFISAAKRLARAGVRLEFGGQGDACGSFNVLRLRGSVKALNALERLAAADARIPKAERAAAAERFQIFLRRNYGADWKANRERYLDVGGSPYADPATWPRST